jgi:hypothetical protein
MFFLSRKPVLSSPGKGSATVYQTGRMLMARFKIETKRAPDGQNRGAQDYSSFLLRTMRYSLRRALSLDSVDGCTHNPTIRSLH